MKMKLSLRTATDAAATADAGGAAALLVEVSSGVSAATTVSRSVPTKECATLPPSRWSVSATARSAARSSGGSPLLEWNRARRLLMW